MNLTPLAHEKVIQHGNERKIIRERRSPKLETPTGEDTCSIPRCATTSTVPESRKDGSDNNAKLQHRHKKRARSRTSSFPSASYRFFITALRLLPFLVASSNSMTASAAPHSRPGSAASTPRSVISAGRLVSGGAPSAAAAALAASGGGRLMDDHSLVKLLFLIIGLFWVLVVVAFLYWAPVVSFLNLMVLAVIVAFIKSEGSTWHHAQEFENRFWTVISFITAAVLVFSPDSPLGLGRWSPVLGWVIVFSVSFAVHSYDRHLHRLNLSRKPEFVRSRRGSVHMRGSSLPKSPPSTPPVTSVSTGMTHTTTAAMTAINTGAVVQQHHPGGSSTPTTTITSTTTTTTTSAFSSEKGESSTSNKSGGTNDYYMDSSLVARKQRTLSCSDSTSSLSSVASAAAVQGSGVMPASLGVTASTSSSTTTTATPTTNNSSTGSNGSTTPTPTPPRLLGILLENPGKDHDVKVADAVARAEMEEKLEVVEHALKEVDQYLIASTVSNWFNMQKVLRLERTIINIFNAARTDELNFLVSHVALGLLIYKVKDHYITSTKHCLNRTDLIEVLAVTRISELGIPERAMVLDALQQMKLTAHRNSEKWVRNIILSTLGDSLSELKTLMDAKGDFQSLHKLIFDDIRSERIRHEILVHIRKQAQVQAAHMKLGTRLARQRIERQPWRKILSDVDDTLASSGGRFPAGIDRRLPRHAIYPGVLGFYRELDLGITGLDEWGPDRDQGNLVFLSARPHVYKDVSEKHSYAKFRMLQEKRGLHTTPTLLAGSLDSGYNYIMERNTEGLAQKKMENFEQFVCLYPEYSFVFIGDNGQGDLRAAELMMERAKAVKNHPRIDAIYIHRIQPLHQSYGYDGEGALDRWRSMGICFFDNYIEAAIDAAVRRSPPLIRMTGLRRVVEAAVDDFAKVEGWVNEREKELRRTELNRWILRANVILTRSGLNAVGCIPASPKSRYEVGSRVMTLYGVGLIRRYRSEDGIYEVILDWTPPAKIVQTTAVRRGSSAGLPVITPSTALSPPQMRTRARSDSMSAIERNSHQTRTASTASTTTNTSATTIPFSSNSTPPSPLFLPSPAVSLSSSHTTSPHSKSLGASVNGTSSTSSTSTESSNSNSQGLQQDAASLSQTPTITPSVRPVSVSANGSGTEPSSKQQVTPSNKSSRPLISNLVVAYLQESAILQVIPSAVNNKSSSSSTAATTASSSLSSYISFFPGASYLTRLRSDRPPRSFPLGSTVKTPYGEGIVLEHRRPLTTVTTAGSTSLSPQATGTAAAERGESAAAKVSTTDSNASSSFSLPSHPTKQTPKQPPEFYVVELAWGGKAYLNKHVLLASNAGISASSKNSSSMGTSGSSKVVPVSSSLDSSQGLLAGVMSLLSLGSGRGTTSSSSTGVKPSISPTIILVPGMTIATAFGQATVRERRESDGTTVLALSPGGVAYIPASRLAEFVTPRRNKNNTTPRRKNSITGGSVKPPLPLTVNTAEGPSLAGEERTTKFLLSPSSSSSISAGTSGGLLGFFKGAVSTTTTVSSQTPAAANKGEEEKEREEVEETGENLPKIKEENESSSSEAADETVKELSTSTTATIGKVASPTTVVSSGGLRGWWARTRRNRRLTVGDRVSVDPYGEAVVLRVRETDNVVEVAFTRWRGWGYVQADSLKLC